ncbi:MAG: DUF3307 domain-containing protein [Paludibacteraceae bacterium]|nr:DUF3307 domain-containing protein [Paludibacteraceae bacterium]
MNTIIILIKLVCAHLCSDFIFQTDSIYKCKSEKRWKGYIYQILHSLIHAIVAYLFISQWSNWVVPTVIFTSHLLIDFTKYSLNKKGLFSFIFDQICHLAVIFVLWFALYGDCNSIQDLFSTINTTQTWAVIAGYILMLRPSSIILSLFLKQWTPSSTSTQSLPNAGQWIGYLERILIMTFIMIGSVEGVGFLLAAKSIFRFGELKNDKEIKTTEYVLIGTLSSFAIAILIGYLVRILFQMG